MGKSPSAKPRRNVFSKSVKTNCIDFFEIPYFQPSNKTDWTRAWVTKHTEEDAESEGSAFIQNNRDNYQYTV
jgi:hypothetical protein